jgi:hypothetical protein
VLVPAPRPLDALAVPPEPVVVPLEPHAAIAAPVQTANESATRYAVFLMLILLVGEAIPGRG